MAFPSDKNDSHTLLKNFLSIPPTDSTFVLDTPPHWNFHSRGCLSKKKNRAKYFYAEDNCFRDKEFFLFMLVPNDLNFALKRSFLVINGKSLRTMEAVRS